MKTKLKVIILLHGSEDHNIQIRDMIKKLIEESILPKYINSVSRKYKRKQVEINKVVFDTTDIEFELD